MSTTENAELLGPCETCRTEVYLIDDVRPGSPQPPGRVMVDLISESTTVTRWADHNPKRCRSFRDKLPRA